MHIHDLIGIGFGPSNLALAIALQERTQDGQTPVDALFIEKQPQFAWHPHMLLDHAHMQISFLKDLATLRNPASPYTFLNYLHAKHRLQDFINLKTFYPSRHEFNDYLSWAAGHFADQCAFGEAVVEVQPEFQGDRVALLRVRSHHPEHGVRERLTRSLVISVGGAANVPTPFAPFKDDPRVFHSSRYLGAMAQQNQPRRMAVIGAGQSASEIFLDLNNRGGIDVDLVMRARSIKPSDDSPFVNEIFNPEFTDYVYQQPQPQRAALLEEFMNTNYAAPDLALIEQIYQVFYRQKVGAPQTHRFLRRHEVEHVAETREGLSLRLRDLDQGGTTTAHYDAIVLATGYVRDTHHALLEPLAQHLGNMDVTRDYRVQATEHFGPAIFLQGCCELTHGLSDTLLSVTSVRTGEIVDSLTQWLHAHRGKAPSRHLAVAF